MNKAYQKRDTLRNPQFFKTWLTRIVINECYGMIRRAQKCMPLEEYLGWDERAMETENVRNRIFRGKAVLRKKLEGTV